MRDVVLVGFDLLDNICSMNSRDTQSAIRLHYSIQEDNIYVQWIRKIHRYTIRLYYSIQEAE